MLVIRLMNPSHNGEVTHATGIIGEVTLGGTLALVAGTAFLTLPLAVTYLLARTAFPTRRNRRVIASAAFFTVVGFPLVLDLGNYEFYRFVPPLISVSLFSLLLPIGGGLMSVLTEWAGSGTRARLHNRFVDVAWSSVVAGAFIVALARDLRDLTSATQLR